MLMISGFVELSGPSFSPARLERETGYSLRDKREPGEICQRGRFQGEQADSGSGILDFQPADPLQPQFELDARTRELLITNQAKLDELGVTVKHIVFNVEYETQCNLELEPSVLAVLGKINIPISICCYQK